MVGLYGRRARTALIDTSIRTIAPTYGRTRITASSDKHQELFVVDGRAELNVCTMLSIDPSVTSYTTQPFTVDLIDQRLLKTKEDLDAARRKHRQRSGIRFYTPDFGIKWSCGAKTALEVKTSDFLGDQMYQRKLQLVREILQFYGWEFSMFIQETATRSPLQSNINALHKAACLQGVARVKSYADSAIAPTSQNSTLGAFCKTHQIPLELASAAVLAGIVGFDLHSHHLSQSAPVFPAYGSLEHLCVTRRSLIQ